MVDGSGEEELASGGGEVGYSGPEEGKSGALGIVKKLAGRSFKGWPKTSWP